MRNKLYCIIGESGSGKNTVERELSAFIKILVNTTSRELRPGEVEGKDYHYITLEEFNKKLENNEFVEFIEVETQETCGRKNKYGLEKRELEKLKKSNALISLPFDRFIALREYMKNVSNIQFIPIYLKTDKKVRFEKLLKRHEGEIDKHIDEIERRMKVDDILFEDIENKIEDLVILENDYDLYSLTKIVSFVVNNSYIIARKGEVCIKTL